MLAAAVWAWVMQPKPAAARAGLGDCRTVTVVLGEWHSEFLLPADAFLPDATPRKVWPDARWFVIGWGDAYVYRHGMQDWLRVLDALVPPSPGVMHVVAFNERPELKQIPFARSWRDVRISEAGLSLLAANVADDFVQQPDGSPRVPLETTFGPHSGFLSATPHYAAWHTCNHWTARHLARAGVPVVTSGVFTPRPLSLQIDGFGLAQACGE